MANHFDFMHGCRRISNGLVNFDRAGVNSVMELELVSHLKEGEAEIAGWEMERRAREDCYSYRTQYDADIMLDDREMIPVEFREFILLFPGTVWVTSTGANRIPSIYYSENLGWIANTVRIDRNELGPKFRLVSKRHE